MESAGCGGSGTGRLGICSCGPLPLPTSPLPPQKGGCLSNTVTGCHQGQGCLRYEGEALSLRLSLCVPSVPVKSVCAVCDATSLDFPETSRRRYPPA